MSGEERRRFVRNRVRLNTIVTILRTGETRRALTKDIGGGGICVVTEEELEAGEVLGVEIKLPDFDRPVTFKAGVVWITMAAPISRSAVTGRYEVGLKFSDIDPKSRSLMLQYAALNAPPPGATL